MLHTLYFNFIKALLFNIFAVSLDFFLSYKKAAWNIKIKHLLGVILSSETKQSFTLHWRKQFIVAFSVNKSS